MHFHIGVRMISHLRLGLRILRMMPMGIAASAAYLFGSVQPDLCFISYMKGVAPGDEMRGHSCRTAMMRIAAMERSSVSGPIEAAYVLGKITHYAADIFTFPHNLHLFSGTLREHMAYERRLDEAIMLDMDAIPDAPDQIAAGVSGYLEGLHGEYEAAKPSMENDISFILRAALSIRACFSYEEGSPAIVAFRR